MTWFERAIPHLIRAYFPQWDRIYRSHGYSPHSIIANSLRDSGGLLSGESEPRHIYWSKGWPAVDLEGRFSPEELQAIVDHINAALKEGV